ncbi:MAG TPA: histidine phosphatase family protein [Reyranella sp.]|jgi:broad specificity phosphatase PhoE|nr:histidine phosphatase family protein [Reyranella sp.]
MQLGLGLMISGVAVALVSTTAFAAGDAEAWAALQKGGHVIIMRHAAAPGPEQGREGDPPGFQLGDCGTQRNLSSTGRDQATEIGDDLRAHHVVITKIMTSPWCRAIDTASLMSFDAPRDTTMLLRNYGEHEGGAGRINRNQGGGKMLAHEAHSLIREWTGPGNLLLVSHGRTVVDILWGDRRMSPEQGVLYVLEPTPDAREPFHIVGSIVPRIMGHQ